MNIYANESSQERLIAFEPGQVEVAGEIGVASK